MAERVGFEPTVRGLGEQPISSRPRYDHFGTSPLAEESSQQALALFPENASPDVNFVIERKLVHIEERAERTPFLIETTKNEPADTCLYYRTGTHDAGFLGHVQGAADQSKIAEHVGTFGNRQDLCVGDG